MPSVFGGVVEVIPDRLLYVTFRSGTHQDVIPRAHFWSADEFTYWNFFLDWGPHSLGNVYRFCRTLNFKLRSNRLEGKAIYVYSASNAYKRTNAVFLLSAWMILHQGKSPAEALAPFRDAFPSFPSFHDASPCACTYNLTILHCLWGLQKASRYRFFDFNKFDVDEYEHLEQVENGDLNWIIDGKFLAFAGPHYQSQMSKDGYRTLTPRNFIPYFKEKNVTLVVRLNNKCYDERLFLDAGIAHLEAYFVDGGTPPPHVLRRFLTACEANPGAIAVHCKAGLGRTGTCIGCYMMKHYGFSAAEAIGWMRICRPGSVIGPQQQYLEQMESVMHREGLALRQQAGREVGDFMPSGVARPAHGHGSFLSRETGGGPNETRQYYRSAAGVEPGRAVIQNTRVSDTSWSKPKSNSQIPSKTATTSITNTRALLAYPPREGHRDHRGPSSRHGPDSYPLVHRATRRKSTGDLDDSQRPRLLEAPNNRNRIVDGLETRAGMPTVVAAASSGRPSMMGARCPHGRRTSSPSVRATVGDGSKSGERLPKKMGGAQPVGGTATNANCTVQPRVDRRTLYVWEKASAGRHKTARTQGDLLLQQRARGAAGRPNLY